MDFFFAVVVVHGLSFSSIKPPHCNNLMSLSLVIHIYGQDAKV